MKFVNHCKVQWHVSKSQRTHQLFQGSYSHMIRPTKVILKVSAIFKLRIKSGTHLLIRTGVAIFLPGSHISWCTAVRGPGILTLEVMWPLWDMLHSTKPANVLWISNFFIVENVTLRPDEMALLAGWKGFSGRMWPACRTLERPGLEQTCCRICGLKTRVVFDLLRTIIRRRNKSFAGSYAVWESTEKSLVIFQPEKCG